MVASSRSLADRFVQPSDPFPSDRSMLVELTWKDALEMVRMGIIPEDASTELLNGWIYLKDRSARDQGLTMIGTGHTKCLKRFSDLRSRINTVARHVRSQQPLICSQTHVPEPDFMVLRGRLDDYTDPPTATDSFCVVEVADSSYERDAGLKCFSYARGGVVQYVIINLRNLTAEVYSGPDIIAGTYPPPQVVTSDQALLLRVGVDEFFHVALAEVLP